jgi:endonuclease/exonuclease/phosphatase family metal-dependent hydrolase
MVHDGQAAQLQAMLSAKDGVTVLMGDLNSDAEASPGAPSYTDTYTNLIAAGFVDAWDESRASSRSSGFTCCHAPELGGPNELDERIDFVLVRSTVAVAADAGDNDDEAGTAGDGGIGAPSPFFRTMIVGEVSRDRTDGGLWPSDHAGLVSSIRYFAPRH